MPIYEYECRKCGGRFEKLVSSSRSSVTCPDCASRRVRRMISAFSAHSGSASGGVPCETQSCPAGAAAGASACASGQCPFS